MPQENLLSALKKRPLVCDGAMGTQLMAAGLKSGACGEKWNAYRSDVVEAIHRAYRQAGCDLITTNTFGGTTAALARHGAEDQMRELNLAGARAARKGAGEGAWILGDIGPFGGFLEPVGDTSAAELEKIFRAQAEALYDAAVDAYIIETMSDPEEMAIAIKAAKHIRPLPVIATYAFNAAGDDFRTMMGASVADALNRAKDEGADVIGANCGTSLNLEDYLRLAEKLVKAAGGTPVIIQPNAGSPVQSAGGVQYPATPEDMGQLAPKLVSAGARIIGGCCGTTPNHLAAMAKAVKGAGA